MSPSLGIRKISAKILEPCNRKIALIRGIYQKYIVNKKFRYAVSQGKKVGIFQ